MRNIWILFKREMNAYFLSPIAYIVGFCFLVAMGHSFSVMVGLFSEGRSDYNIMQLFMMGMFTWMTLLVIVPVITMRLFADEKKSGTIESLMTTPLRDIEYVLAKFLSAYCFFILLWAPTFNYIFVLRYFAGDKTPLDLGPIIGGYIGFGLLGMLFIAMGCMASALTRNQIIAAIISFALCCSLFLGGIYFYTNGADKNRNFYESISILAHMQQMSRGIIDWRYVVFYLSTSGFFLFVTHRIVQSRRWRS